MRYLLLIYGPEQTEQPSPEEQAAVMQAYDAFTKNVKSIRFCPIGDAQDLRWIEMEG